VYGIGRNAKLVNSSMKMPLIHVGAISELPLPGN
jgi:hypothetical protein